MKNEMTDEELNIAIHKWLGGKWHEPFDQTANAPCKCCGAKWLDVIDENPNYCQDLNTVQKFLREVFIKRTPLEIIRSLMGVQGYRFPGAISDWTAVEVMGFMMATPRQLAEAGAKAVGIYEEV